jgi:hypothetical protein
VTVCSRNSPKPRSSLYPPEIVNSSLRFASRHPIAKLRRTKVGRMSFRELRTWVHLTLENVRPKVSLPILAMRNSGLADITHRCSDRVIGATTVDPRFKNQLLDHRSGCPSCW